MLCFNGTEGTCTIEQSERDAAAKRKQLIDWRSYWTFQRLNQQYKPPQLKRIATEKGNDATKEKVLK